MLTLLALLVFVLLVALCLFHVLIVKATAWGFVALFVLVVYSMARKEEPQRTRDPAMAAGQSNSATLALIKAIEAKLPHEESGPSDARYEAAVSYPPMEMEQEL